VDFGDPRLANDVERAVECRVVLLRKPDDDVRREVEAGERGDLRQVLRGRVAPPHRPQNDIVTGLERDVQMSGRAFGLHDCFDEIRAQMIDLDRGQPQPLDSGHRPRLAHKPRECVAGLAIAEATQVHTCEHDLPMTLRHAPANLREHALRTSAARLAPDEWDDAEGARERATVLDLHERPGALEPRLALGTPDRADIRCHHRRRLVARARDDVHVPGQAFEGVREVGRTARDIDPPMRPRRTSRGLPRLRYRLVRDAARVDDGDVGAAVLL
jgi:hypothetical protein